MHTSTLKSYFQSTIKVTLFIALILQQLIMWFGGIGILSAYADTDAYGTTIQKTIVNNTDTGVDFRIDRWSTGTILSGFILKDLFTPNLNFLSKNDSSLTGITNFTSWSNYLSWIFNTNITPGTTGSIFLNFSKNGTGQFTNTGQLYGTKDVCDIINNNNVVSTNFDVTPPNFVAPNHDVMIDKKEGICNPTSGIIPWGWGIFDPGMISWFQSIFNWNCTNTAPLSKYNLWDDVYYTLYIHNYWPSLVTQLAVADVFENKWLQFVSVSGNYFGQKSYVTWADLLTFTNWFSLWVNRGAFVTLRFKVIADEYSPLNNEAKTRIMIGGPSQKT